MLIRDFVAADADEVAALIQTTLFESNAADYPLSELESLADWYSAEGLTRRMQWAHRIVAVEPDGTIVGTAARREDSLEGFFVEPRRQGQGIGGALLAALEDGARDLGIATLVLESSLTAVAFYKRSGFVALDGPRDGGDGLVVPMAKRL